MQEGSIEESVVEVLKTCTYNSHLQLNRTGRRGL